MSKAINPNQFKMFMSPREVLGSVQALNDIGAGSGMRMLAHPEMQRKLSSAIHGGLGDKIAESGVMKPVDLLHKGDDPRYTEFANGHHRLAVQGALDPDRLMPVMHHETTNTMDFTDAKADPSGDRSYTFGANALGRKWSSS